MKNIKNFIALEKHLLALKGTGFERCASCPGCGGRLEGEYMRCSRAGASPVLVTVGQARSCDGKRPALLKQEQVLQISPVFTGLRKSA